MEKYSRSVVCILANCCILNEDINLPSFLTLFCIKRESTLTTSESAESRLDLYGNRGQYFS